MKKIALISIIFLISVVLATTVVTATSKESLLNELYSLTSKYGITEADKVKAERFLSENEITDEQAEQVYAKAKEAIKIIEDAGVTDVKKLNSQLTKEQKKQFESICQEGAKIVNVTLTYRNSTVEVYKEGKKIETFTFTNGKLAYTGSEVNMFLVISLVAIIGIATVVIVRKKLSHE